MTQILWAIAERMGCGTYRAYVPALGLKDRGVADSSFVLHEKAEGVADLEGMDVLVLQRACYPKFMDWVREARRRRMKVLVEMDDDLWDIPKRNPSHAFWEQKEVRRILTAQLDAADLVMVSTRPLANRVQEEMHWRSQDKIRLCPNHVHPAVWGDEVIGPVVPYTNTHIILGWQGSRTHDVDFMAVLPALQRILTEFPQTMLRLLGNVPQTLKGRIPESRFQWMHGVEFHKYPALLRYANFDIGLAPLTDAKFNRSKSNVKWLEYSAVKVPCVASRVYPYARSIEDGVTGFLAEGETEWYEKLRTLILDADLRRRVAEAAHRQVWSVWSDQQHTQRWVEVLEEVCGGERRKHVRDSQFWGEAGVCS